jgi:toxin ParE1/3/4
MQTFGVRQTKIYETTLRQALHALSSGPDIPGVQQREDLGPGIRTLHVARKGRKGRHLIVLRIGSDRIIDVLRLLHDSMDLPSHLPP